MTSDQDQQQNGARTLRWTVGIAAALVTGALSLGIGNVLGRIDRSEVGMSQLVNQVAVTQTQLNQLSAQVSSMAQDIRQRNESIVKLASAAEDFRRATEQLQRVFSEACPKTQCERLESRIDGLRKEQMK